MLNKIVFVTFLFRLITYLLDKISTRNYRELSLPLLFHFPQTLFNENSHIIPHHTSLPPPPPPPFEKNCIGFVLLHSVTGLENSQNPPKQSEVTLKAITIWSLVFLRLLSKSLFYFHIEFLFISF